MTSLSGGVQPAGPVIGIDIGGTKSLGVLRLGDREVARCEMPTPSGVVALVETIVSLTADLERRAGDSSLHIDASSTVGIGLPGLVTRSGILRSAPNLVDVVEFDAKRVLEERMQRRVWLDNDATCAAVAEWLEGAGKGCTDLLLVTLGTGIGSGFVSNGRLVRGANGFAGEIGHMIVDPLGPACPCGRNGCWERYASGSGLAMLARRAIESGRLGVASLSPDDVRGEDVVAQAAKGDTQARAVIDDFGYWVAVGLANMTNVLDPQRIIIGGGAARMGELLLGPVRRWLKEVLYASDHRPIPDVLLADFGESAGAVGAGMLPLVH